MTPQQERAGLLFWRAKIDKRLAELERQLKEQEGLLDFLHWQERRQPRRRDR